MPTRPSLWPFLATNAAVWILMVVILVVVPDTLERWIPFELARVVGWALACGVWVVVVEREWQLRFRVFTRFALQLALWVSAAMVAIWISDFFKVT